MTITMPSAGPTNQLVTILTDIQNSYPSIVCPISGTLSPSKAWISFTNPNLEVTHSSITLPADLGTYTFTLNVDSSTWPALVTNQDYTFTVII
jgi:hypothetical protein